MDKLYKKYLEEFNGNEEKTKQKIELINEFNERLKKRNTEFVIDLDLKEILSKNNIILEELDNSLSKLNYKREVEYDEDIYLNINNNSLGKYCEEKGYYYPLIYRLIEKSNYKNVSLIDIIEDYKINSRKYFQGYFGTKDEKDFNKLLRKLGLYKDSYLRRDIELYRYTPLESLMNYIFRKVIKGYEWLEVVYDYEVENKILNKSYYDVKIEKMKELLNNEENNKLQGLTKIYDEIVKEYKKNEELMGIEPKSR